MSEEEKKANDKVRAELGAVRMASMLAAGHELSPSTNIVVRKIENGFLFDMEMAVPVKEDPDSEDVIRYPVRFAKFCYPFGALRSALKKHLAMLEGRKLRLMDRGILGIPSYQQPDGPLAIIRKLRHGFVVSACYPTSTYLPTPVGEPAFQEDQVFVDEEPMIKYLVTFFGQGFRYNKYLGDEKKVLSPEELHDAKFYVDKAGTTTVIQVLLPNGRAYGTELTDKELLSMEEPVTKFIERGCGELRLCEWYGDVDV